MRSYKAYYKLNKKGIVVKGVIAVYCTEGASCYYCVRIWNSKFMELYTLTEYKTEISKDLDKRFDGSSIQILNHPYRALTASVYYVVMQLIIMIV